MHHEPTRSRRQAETRKRDERAIRDPTNTAITIRRMDVTDADRPRLAQARRRSTRRRPLDGPVLGAEVEGGLLAAISLTSGELDRRPVPPDQRAAGAAASASRPAQRPGRRPSAARTALRRARLALGGSPAGEIISLPGRAEPTGAGPAPSDTEPLRGGSDDTRPGSSRAQLLSSGAIVRPASLELLPVELRGLARAGPDDRLARVVDPVGER